MAVVSQPSPLTPARQRALALASAGDLGGARALLEQAVELGKVNLSEDDPDVLRTSYQLGRVLQQGDDPAGARRVLEEAYAAGLWRLGDSDPLMLEISHDIGVVAEELGNRHEARKAFGRVAELGPAVLGGEHWAVVRARGYLGHDQKPQGQDLSSVRAQAAPALTEPTVQLGLVGQRPQTAATEEIPRIPAQPHQPAALTEQLPRVSPQPQLQPQAAVTEQLPRISAVPHAQSQAAATEQLPRQPQAAVTEQLPRSPAEQPPAVAQHPEISQEVARRASVEPPSPANQHVWVDPGRDTVAQPIVFARDQMVEVAPHWSGQSGYHDSEREPKAYRKSFGLFGAIAGGLAAVIAVVALVFVLASRSGGGGGEQSDVPTLGGPPPSDVQLIDSGSGIEVRWQDPSDGTVSFMVAMGHPGEQLKPVTTLGPGQTSYELSGLNPSLNYCFTVIAVYRSDQFATSPQACTSRASATPR